METKKSGQFVKVTYMKYEFASEYTPINLNKELINVDNLKTILDITVKESGLHVGLIDSRDWLRTPTYTTRTIQYVHYIF